MTVPEGLRVLSFHLEPCDGVLEDCNLTVEHGHIDLLADSCLLPLVERRDNTDRREQSRGNVADRDADPGRRTVRPAGDTHEPAEGLYQNVISRLLRVRPAVAETTRGGVDQSGIELPKALVAESELLHDPGPEVLHDHVKLWNEGAEERSSLLVFEVQGDALLLPVDAGEVEAATVLEGAEVP